MQEKPEKPAKAATRGKGQKRLASPTSTGGAGVTYEVRVQASYLLAMFAGSPTAVLPDAAVVELRFQGRVHGYHTDDLICTLRLDDGSTLKALLQVKLTLKAIPSDGPFSESLIAAWYDYQDCALFQRGRDRLVVVYSRDADGSGIYVANQLAQFARTSLKGTEFVRKATAERFSSKQQRGVYETIKAILRKELGAEPSSDELHDFLRHLWFVPHALATDETPEVANIFESIKLVLGAELGHPPRTIWALLTTACQSLNKGAASLSFANLDTQLSPRLAAAFAAHRGSPAARLPFANLHADPTAGVAAEPAFAPGVRDDVRMLSVTPVRRSSGPVDGAGLSAGRLDSANRVITGQLDAINEKLKQFRYLDASGDVSALGKDLGPFDAHQKARWYLQRGVCAWHLGDAKSSATDFLRAAELFPDDERMSAAGIRGRLLSDDLPGALASGKEASERFPESIFVWAVYANARILDGQKLSLTDVPARHRDGADALQLVAASLNQAGDKNGTIKVSLQSLTCADAGFYTRLAALSTVLEAATANKVFSTFRLADERMKAALLEVTTAFNPRTARLWNVQAPGTVSDAAANLGIALLLQGDPEGALAFVQEARAHGVEPPELLRVELEALQQMGNTPAMLTRGRALLPRLREDAIVGLAQAAANVGDVPLANEALAVATHIPTADTDVLEMLRAIRWIAMWNAEDREAVQAEARLADFSSSLSLPVAISGFRVLRHSDPELAAVALGRAEQLVAAHPAPENTLLLADLFFDIKEYSKASQLYEKVVPPGQLSDLHARLLHSYIQTGNRRKAKKLIEGFPEGWVRDDNARGLAIELAQDVGDWPLLKGLADAQFAREPNQVSSWLFRFMVAARELPVAELQQLLAEAPLALEGSIPQTTQLAAQELRYGLQHKGMHRMYRLRRRKAADVEAASALLLAFVSISEQLPNMEESLPAIAAGTHFVLADGAEQIHVTLDPSEVGELPTDEEYHSAQATSIVQFIGKKVGEEVVVEGSFRTRRVLRVEEISSAYRRLLDQARVQMDRSLAPVPNATSIPIGTSADGEPDFSELHEQLKKQSAHVKKAFQGYSTAPITLGGFGRLIGKGPVDVVCGWPTSQEAPAMFVTVGTVEEREGALAQLSDSTASYVVDAGTMAELVALGATEALRALPKVYATSETRDILLRRLEETELERKSGTLLDDDGCMRLVEYTDRDRERARLGARAMVDALESICEVAPAYGPESGSELLTQLEKAISDEEHAVLRLAVERNLCLMTVDGRLRNVARHVNVRGVWPQALLMHATVVGKLTPRAYSQGTVQMFLGNRSFVSLGPRDLLLMCHQGTQWARHGIARYKRYLADPRTEFGSAFQTTLDFVQEAAFSFTHMGALAELLRHMVEALMRHKDCPKNILGYVEEFVSVLLGEGSPYPYPALKEMERAEKRAGLKYLVGAMVEGQAWTLSPAQDRPVHIKVLAVGRTPWIVSSSADEDLASPLAQTTSDTNASTKR
ncbi:PIN domain-containing protein [Achromobacter deleyi]|uniref:PIN domain-containing protein n=1 Tax=Achromobacter deleyi TaxID=1353891 RepID=UPI001490FEFE|nr:hypothetical protein [Achromobacter deleyi]QVQ28258.1 hypothetical protein HLG70_07510 [Achromobacter deleyi]